MRNQRKDCQAVEAAQSVHGQCILRQQARVSSWMKESDREVEIFGETQQLGTAGGKTGGEIDEVGKI